MDDFVPTRAVRAKKGAEEKFQSVTYTAYKKKEKSTDDLTKKISKDEEEARLLPRSEREERARRKQELEMKRVRHDIIKFGMSGFDKEKAQEAKVALAVTLGAKPPKNKAKNYKDLKLEKKEKGKGEIKIASGVTSSLKKHKSKNVKKKDTGILKIYGKVHKTAKKK